MKVSDMHELFKKKHVKDDYTLFGKKQIFHRTRLENIQYTEWSLKCAPLDFQCNLIQPAGYRIRLGDLIPKCRNIQHDYLLTMFFFLHVDGWCINVFLSFRKSTTHATKSIAFKRCRVQSYGWHPLLASQSRRCPTCRSLQGQRWIGCWQSTHTQ